MNPHVTAITILKEVQAIHPGFPVNYEHVAAYISREIVGIPIQFHFFTLPPEVTALCSYKSYYGKIHILLNKIRPRESQRFGAFHELGHLACKHRNGIRIYGDKYMGEEDPLERKEADYFATYTMMPEVPVLQLATQVNHPLRLAFKMKDTFGSSVEASVRRIIEMQIYRGAYFLYDPYRLYFGYNTPDISFDDDKLKHFLISEYFRLKPDDRVEREFADGTMEYCAKYRSGQVLLALVRDNGNVYERLSKSCSEWFGMNLPILNPAR